MNNNSLEALVFTDASSFISWVEKRTRGFKKTSLKNMEYYVSLFDHPENLPCIHVTGTNGKGSTVNLLANIYQSKGLIVGTYTSPYVTVFNERIMVNEKPISDNDLLYYGNMIISKFKQMRLDGYEEPSFFEFITLLAFLYFSHYEGLDLVIFEVGMGGRLDATNVITPFVSAITNVSLEHLGILGNTKEEILKEKLGIVKNGVPLVTSINDDSLLDIVKTYCKNKDSMLITPRLDKLKVKKMDIDGSIFSYKDKEDIFLPLIGMHQIENCLLAIEVVEELNKLSSLHKNKFYITNEILYRGIKNAFWPGRLEKVSEKPLIYLDGGHNIDCIKRVCEFVKLLNYPNKRVVVAISNDKEKKDMISYLDDTFDELIFTHYTYKRSADALELYNLSNSSNKLLIENVKDTISYVNEHPCSFTLFMGSLYLISEVRPYFKKN